jgi:hypothetical protein
LILPGIEHPSFTQRHYLVCARYYHEIYSINELHDLDYFPWESRCSGPEIRPSRHALGENWNAFEKDYLFGPKGMGKGCRSYFPDSVCAHVAGGTQKPDKERGLSHRQVKYGGAYKWFRNKYVSLQELTVLLPYSAPIDCIPTKFHAARAPVPPNKGGSTVLGPTICDNRPPVGTSPIWLARVCLKTEVEESGSVDRIVPDRKGRYMPPELGHVVTVRQDPNGRFVVQV